jgi:dienelactone hydrolase
MSTVADNESNTRLPPATSDGVAPIADSSPLATAAAAKPPSVWLTALHSLASGVTWATILVTASLALEFDLGIPRLLLAAVAGLMGFAFLAAGEGIAVLVWKLLSTLFARLGLARGAQLLSLLPPLPVGRLLAAFVFIAGDLLWPNSFLQSIVLPVVGEIAIVLAGLAVMTIALARMDGRSRPAQLAIIGPPFLLILAYAAWVVNPGFDNYVATAPETAVASPLTIADPGQPGPHTVQSLSYGSGQNRHRPEFGANADLVTPAVDGSTIFGGYSGLVDAYYQWYWGFDFRRLPLNGAVWYPAGDGGPRPLVLITHGNHPMTRPSDLGYAYLGEHLASQGYIAVSVDQNFLNGLMFVEPGFAELPLRAWLLLQHVRQWQAWHETAGNPFTGQVDLSRVALIGHSRGGEAAAWAAEMNWYSIPGLSDAADFGFGVRGVVAIAPSDRYTGPDDRKPILNRANYLLLAAGHDADSYLLFGQQQYSRLRSDRNPDGFKALAYLYQGNHGQFNSVWGDQDRGLYNSWLLNRAPLLSQSEQQQAAKALITGFLHAALQDEAAYRDLFRNPVTAVPWLPESIIVTRYQDASVRRINTSGGTAEGGLSAQEETLKLRDGEMKQGNQVLRLAWTAGSQPQYAVTLSPGQATDWKLTPDHLLTFALASVPGEPVAAGPSISLETAAGLAAQLPLADFGPILPQLPAHLVKAGWLAGLRGFPAKIAPEEIVLQSYTLPLSAFQAANPSWQPEQLQTIRFHFDGAAAGAIYLDEIGLAPP